MFDDTSLWRLNRVLFSLLMLVAWTATTQLSVQAADSPAATESVAARRAAAVHRLGAAFKALEAAAKQVPTDTFSLADVAASLGQDPLKISGWVRDNTAWVPYAGALRGPLGVLMDRRGNSLDRASLTAELLRRSGKTVRLVRGQLSDAAAADLLPRLIAHKPTEAALDARDNQQVLDDVIKNFAAPAGLDSADVRKYATDALDESQRRSEDIVSRTAVQTATLARMLWPNAAAANAPAKLGDAKFKNLADGLKEHWWAQWSNGAAWTDADLEPLVGPPPPAAQTIDWAVKDDLYQFDAAQCQTLTVRVTIEKWDGGRLVEQPVLTHTLRPMDTVGKGISISTFPMAMPTDLPQGAGRDAKFKELALAQHEWLPMLQIGAEQIHQGSFTDSGKVDLKPVLASLGRAGKSSGGAAGAAVDALGGDAIAEKPTVLTATWIDYEINVPGQAPQTIRRQLFDLVGPAARAAGNLPMPALDEPARLERGLILLGSTQVLPLSCQLSPSFRDDVSARELLRSRNALMALVASDGSNPQADLQTSGQLAGQPLPSARLYDLAVARGVLHSRNVDMYLDRPVILSLHQFPLAAPNGELRYVEASDIVTNETAVRPGMAAVDARIVTLEQGVLDTNVEALGHNGQGVSSHNASDFLDANPDASSWLVVRSADDPAWLKTSVSPDVRARIDADLAAGCVVAFPRVAIAAGASTKSEVNWWRLDPRTGAALGINSRGWGPEMVEYAFVASYSWLACVVGAAVSAKGSPSMKAIGICFLVALGSALTLSSALTLQMLVGYTLLNAGAGAAVS